MKFFVSAGLLLSLYLASAIFVVNGATEKYSLFEAQPDPPTNGCECKEYSCGCCAHMEVKRIDLNSTVCTNFTYLNEDYGMSFTITWNGYAIYNETVSARNPPPYCIGAPFMKEWAEVCMRFHDLNATSHSLHGCVDAEAEFKGIKIAKYDLGCFTIGPKHVKDPVVSVVII